MCRGREKWVNTYHGNDHTSNNLYMEARVTCRWLDAKPRSPIQGAYSEHARSRNFVKLFRFCRSAVLHIFFGFSLDSVPYRISVNGFG